MRWETPFHWYCCAHPALHIRLRPGNGLPLLPTLGQVMSGGTSDFYNWLGRGWGWYCRRLVGEVSFVLFESLSIPWTVAHQAPLSVGFPRRASCSGLPLPPPEDLPNPAIEPTSPALQADSLPLSHLEMLLHNLQGTGQPPAMNPYPAPSVHSAEAEKPAPHGVGSAMYKRLENCYFQMT